MLKTFFALLNYNYITRIALLLLLLLLLSLQGMVVPIEKIFLSYLK